METVIAYRIELVGGPFDGAGVTGAEPAMNWLDDGEHPLPEMILVGVCPGNGACDSTARERCERTRRKHTYFWLPGEAGRPARVSAYELSDSYRQGEVKAKASEYPGRAIYTISGLQLPNGPQAERELVAAGHHEQRSEA